MFSVVEKTCGFLYRIILSRTLGSEGMGIYQIALSVFAVLATAAASGIPLTVSRLITKYRAKNNAYAQKSVVTAALVCALAFSIPAFSLLYFGHSFFDFLFSDPRCMAVLLILLPSLVFNSVYSVIRGALWGNKQFMPYCIIDLLEELTMIVAGVVLVSAMTDVLDGAKRAAVAIVLSYLVSFTLSGIWYFAKGGRLNNPRRQFRPLLSSALPITGMRTSNSLINSVISLILPARLIAAGMTNAQAMSQEHTKMRVNLEHALQITTLIACALIPPLFVLGDEIGILLFSSRQGGEIIRNCCFMLLPMSLGMITTSALNSIGCEKQTCAFFFAGAAATLLCVWFLPQIAGIYALLIGMTASSCITMVLNFILLAKKSKEKVCFQKHTLCSAAAILPACLFGILLKNVLFRLLPTLPATLLCGAILAAAEALFLLALGLAQPRWVKLLFRKS